MAKARSGERRREILETLARMLEERQGEHITTAALAKAVGVSEAALYRHFPSKAKMFEGLIEFIEESIFTRINRILEDNGDPATRLKQTVFLVLAFADKNPGMARLMHGDALVGETERLRRRMSQFYDRLETLLRQVLREGQQLPSEARIGDGARLALALVEGRVAGFVRSGFRDSPSAGWEESWAIFEHGLFDVANR